MGLKTLRAHVAMHTEHAHISVLERLRGFLFCDWRVEITGVYRVEDLSPPTLAPISVCRMALSIVRDISMVILETLQKLINKCKVVTIRRYNMEWIEHALKNSGNIKAVRRRLDIGQKHMSALRDKEGYVATNTNKIVKVPEEFYTYYTVAWRVRIIMEEQLVHMNLKFHP